MEPFASVRVASGRRSVDGLYSLVSVLKLLESLESFVIERRQSDSWGCRCGRRKTDRDTIVII